MQQFAGGASNLTYLLRYPDGDLILRRPPSGQKAKGAHDMGREYRIQAALAPVFPLVPAMVGLCEDESVIGSEFYVMERVDGTIPRRDFPPGARPHDEDATALCSNALDVLIDLHRVDAARRPAWPSSARAPGYVERQVAGWSKRFRNAQHRRRRRLRAGDGLAGRAPARRRRRSCLIHNDFRFDNLVLDRRRPDAASSASSTGRWPRSATR